MPRRDVDRRQKSVIDKYIPAVNFVYQGHGYIYLPTMDVDIHGDHIADFATVPSEDYLLSFDNMKGSDNAFGAKLRKQPYFPSIKKENLSLPIIEKQKGFCS